MADDALDPPLRVDWLGADELGDGRPGRLGLTFLPGKHGRSTRYPGLEYRRELDRDLVTLGEAGVTLLLLLVEDDELTRWGDMGIVEAAERRGLPVVRRPLPDGTAPRSAAEMDEMLSLLGKAREAGDVAVACMGGVGRTGLVAACALVAAGMEADRAIARVRAVRHPEAVETAEQLAFVGAYERHVEAGAGSATVAP
jgi:protein-tyrosine phosphatase